jgi:hypothetical protein
VKSLSQWIQDNINHNEKQDYSHIKDPYFKDKLDKGLIKYEPTEWVELSPFDERGLK